MTPKQEAEIAQLMRNARERSRGYADFFLWATDRDLEEWGIVKVLVESLELDGKSLLFSVQSRGRPNDPPDCEAVNAQGERVAIEVTELVDGEAIHHYKIAEREGRSALWEWAGWSKEKFLSELQRRISEK
jgi:hypothetical protein